MNPPRARFRKPLRTLLAAGALLCAVLLASCASTLRQHLAGYRHLRAYAREHAGDRDLSPDRPSANGLYRAVITPQEHTIPLGRLHAWTLHVEAPAGVPVDGATITVGGGMPEHGHGLPTRPRVTRALGNGDYLVEGMKFQMPGWWVVEFEIAAPGGTDTVTFNLML